MPVSVPPFTVLKPARLLDVYGRCSPILVGRDGVGPADLHVMTGGESAAVGGQAHPSSERRECRFHVVRRLLRASIAAQICDI